MLDRIPHLDQFSRLYCHQSLGEIHESIADAFRQFLADAARLPDGGSRVRRAVRDELAFIARSPEYARWLQDQSAESEASWFQGGWLVRPDEAGPLLSILDEEHRRAAADEMRIRPE